MTKPTLSICIPTYNRARYLDSLLHNIFTQLEHDNLLQKIEVAIADNASTDNTEGVVKKFEERYPHNILYFRNEKNLGFDRSFVKLIEKSSGEYCLSIGDDDGFFDGALSLIVQKIEHSNTPFYGLNYWGYDSDLKNPVLPHPNFQLSHDIQFKTLGEYVKSIRKYTDLVGNFVGLSTQLFLRKPFVDFKNKERYFDTLAVHMHTLLSIYKNSPYAIIASPTIKVRASNIRWDVFAGLETTRGRIKETIRVSKWVRDTFNLPISDAKMSVYFFWREYWFTFKEIVKRALHKSGLSVIIALYRNVRKLLR